MFFMSRPTEQGITLGLSVIKVFSVSLDINCLIIFINIDFSVFISSMVVSS